jgi:hypothetical protein
MAELKKNHIRLHEESDSLVWSRNKTIGTYIGKLGYQLMQA